MHQQTALHEKKLTILTPARGWLRFDISELWISRELIWRFVHRDFISSYKQTVLGPFWFVVPPIATTLIFTIVFGKIANIPTDGAPPFLFYMIAVVLWNFFANCVTRTSNTFTGNAGLFGKVYIPRLTVPISMIISNLASFFIQCFLFLAFYAWFGFREGRCSVNMAIFLFPLSILVLAVLGMGVGCIVSAMTTRYRDLGMMVGFGMQIWMYASCVVYPLSQVQPQWRWFLSLNPVVPVIEAARYAFFGNGELLFPYFGIAVFTACMVLLIGMIMFKRIEQNFIDTV